MQAASNLMVAIGTGTGAVAVVLLRGLANMPRGGSPNLSQKPVHWRAALQFAVILIVGVLWFRG
jgi:hypothetical protein